MSTLIIKTALNHGARDCRALLNSFTERKNPPIEAKERLFRKVLARMAATIFEVTTHPELRQESIRSSGDRLYFWPGYVSLESGLRFSFYERYEGRRISSGLAVCTKCSGENSQLRPRCSACRRPSLTAAAFYDLLSSDHKDVDTVGEIPFVPGGTHPWVVRSAEATDIPLVSLNIETASTGMPSAGPHVRIPLEDSHPWTWGMDVATHLSNMTLEWPLPLDDTFETQHEGQGKLATIVALRKHLYSAWLTASLRPASGDTREWRTFIAALKATDASDHGLSSLMRRLSNILSAKYQDQHNLRRDEFNHWYTLPLSPSVNLPHLTDSSDIGSAMFFTTFRINEPILEAIGSWIQSIFDMLRVFETGRLLKAQGEASVAGAFLHEIKHLGSALSKRMLVPLDSMFSIDQCPQDYETAKDSLGDIVLRPDSEWIRNNSGFAPFRDDILGIGTLMTLWSMSDAPGDLPFKVTADTSLEGFIKQCWGVASRAVLAFVVVPETRSTISGLREYRLRRENVQKIFASQQLKCSFCETWFVTESPATVWFGRAMVALLKNCVQHGDLFSPVRISVQPGIGRPAIAIKVSNIVRHPDAESFAELTQIATGIDKTEASKIAYSILSRIEELETLEQAVGRRMPGRKHSRHVVTMCIEEAGGRVTYWPPHDQSITTPVPWAAQNEKASDWYVELEVPETVVTARR